MRPTLYACMLMVSSACAGSSGDQDYGPGETEDGQCLMQPGEYQVVYSVVADTCDIGPLATELLVVADNGQVIGNPDPPDGCDDEIVFRSGCQVGLARVCNFKSEGYDLDFEADFVYDFDRGIGTVRIDARAYYTGTDILGQVCQTTQRANISAID